MNKNSTLKGNNLIKKNVHEPSLKTLDFLKKFSRAYHVSKDLPQQFNETILN